MNSTLLAAAIATTLGIGLVIGLGALSLLTGAFHFLFARPKLHILKTRKGANGFAFGFIWNSAREPAKIDKVKLRLYNAHGTPTQVIVSREFDTATSSFARDLDMGVGMADFLGAKGFDDALIEVEVSSLSDSITHFFSMRGHKFKEKLQVAIGNADDFNEKYKLEKTKPLYHTVQKSFIAEPLPQSNKTLKIATNPEFAGEFASAEGAGGGADASNNFSVTKVWIEPGCIVCDACETIYPEVFEVQDETCVIRPDYPKDNGLLVEEAADACPVEVIKFTKA